MQDYIKDKKWSDRFLPEIKQILGLHLIGEPPIEEDQERNTDLIVLKMDAVRISCRVRKHEYYLKYPDEFTIRSGRPSKIKTELTKIIEGWGNYFFYGFSNPEETILQSWNLISLNEFRTWFNRELIKRQGKMPGIQKANKDGSSDFIVFNLDEIKKDSPKIIFAESSHSAKKEKAS